MNDTLISIIVPVYNAANYLSKCIESIVNQPYSRFEILLIDDGSKDESGAICDKYAEEDERIKAFHKDNGGVSSARNLGLSVAQGEYVMFVDADDSLESNALQTLAYKVAEKKYDIVIFEYSLEYSGGNLVPYIHPEIEGELSVEQAIYYTITPVNRFCCTKLYRRQILSGLLFNESIHLGEDTLFACQAMAKSKSAFFISKPLYCYFQSTGSATRKTGFNKKLLTGRDAYLILIELCKEYFPALEQVAIAQYLDILIWVIVEMYKEKKANEANIRAFQREVFIWSKQLKRIPEYGIRSKLKVLCCKINPGILVFIRGLKGKK